jgi:hypothetical protein
MEEAPQASPDPIGGDVDPRGRAVGEQALGRLDTCGAQEADQPDGQFATAWNRGAEQQADRQEEEDIRRPLNDRSRGQVRQVPNDPDGVYDGVKQVLW